MMLRELKIIAELSFLTEEKDNLKYSLKYQSPNLFSMNFILTLFLKCSITYLVVIFFVVLKSTIYW